MGYYFFSSTTLENTLNAAPERQAEINALRADLLALLRRTGDPLAEAFAHREKPELLREAKQKLMDEYERSPKNKKRAGKQGKRNKAQAAGDKTAGAAEE